MEASEAERREIENPPVSERSLQTAILFASQTEISIAENVQPFSLMEIQPRPIAGCSHDIETATAIVETRRDLLLQEIAQLRMNTSRDRNRNPQNGEKEYLCFTGVLCCVGSPTFAGAVYVLYAFPIAALVLIFSKNNSQREFFDKCPNTHLKTYIIFCAIISLAGAFCVCLYKRSFSLEDEKKKTPKTLRYYVMHLLNEALALAILAWGGQELFGTCVRKHLHTWPLYKMTLAYWIFLLFMRIVMVLVVIGNYLLFSGVESAVET